MGFDHIKKGGGLNFDSSYLKLDTTNDPLTGDLQIEKSNPLITLTDSAETTNSKITRLATNDATVFTSDIRPYFAARAINFNGSGYASRAGVTLGTVYTVEYWLKSTQTTTYVPISGANLNNLIVYVPYSTQMRAYVGTSTYRYWSIAAKNDGNWHHYVLARNGLAVTLYIDGVSQGGGTLAGVNNNNSTTFTTVGRYHNGGSNVGGTIDQVVLWSTTLSSGDVTTRYNSGNGLIVDDYTNVIAEYRFDNNYNDSSPNNYTLTAGGSGNTFVTGRVAGADELHQEITYLNVYESGTDESAGYLELGWDDGLTTSATQNVYNGLTHNLQVYGADAFTIDKTSNLRIPNDSKKLYFGADDDYSIEFDGSKAIHTASTMYLNATSVGIGVASPGYSLHTSGVIVAQSDIVTEQDLYTNTWRNFSNGVNVATSTNSDGDVTFSGSVKLSENFSTNVTLVSSTSHSCNDEHIILVDDDTAASTVTLNLPAISGKNGMQYTIKKLGTTANVVIDGNASETIDGNTTYTMSTQYEVVRIVTDGSNGWFII